MDNAIDELIAECGEILADPDARAAPAPRRAP